MLLRRLALTTACAAALAAPLAAPAAAAPPRETREHHDVRVCSAAPAGRGVAACHARAETDDRLRPLATTSYRDGLTPAQLQTAYGVAGLSSTATVAVVDAYAHPRALADLNAYRAQFGLGPADGLFTQVNQNGGSIASVGSDVGWGQEEMLDLEMVSALCPTCSILYVAGSSASFTDLGTAVNTAVALGATVVSNSYGAKEFRGETNYAKYYRHPGVAITVSSGDSGYGAEVPAAFNSVTAVGGTSLTLNADGTRASETVWSGAGSGCSAYVTKPSWQHDAGCSRRTVADVAAVADPATGVAVYDSFGSTGGANWYVFGGTSVAAPIIGAIYALSGNTAGTPASIAYTTTGRAALYDVTSGSNGSCRSNYPYLCTGRAGYDGPTGNGTPVGTGAF